MNLEEEKRRYLDSVQNDAKMNDYVFPEDTSFEDFCRIRKEQIEMQKSTVKRNDAFLDEFLGELEKKERLSSEEKKELVEFTDELNTGIDSLDDGMLYRVYSILYNDAMTRDNLNERVKYVYYRAYYSYCLERMSPDYDSFSGFSEIREYLDVYELLNSEGRSFFMRAWCNQLLHHGLDWQTKKEILDFVVQKKEEDSEGSLPYDRYILAVQRNIKNVYHDILACDEKGEKCDEGMLELAYNSSEYIYNNMMHMKNNPRANRLNGLLYYYLGKFHTGQIGLDELIDELERINVIEDDYNAMEKASVHFRLDHMISAYRKTYGSEISDNDTYRMFMARANEATEFIRSLKFSELNSTIVIEYWDYLERLTEHLRYENMKPYFMDALKYWDKDLYNHSLAVTSIATRITEALLEDRPEYFVGMKGYDTLDDVLSRKKEILNAINYASIFHDIGKFRLLNLVGIHYRSLTKEEKRVIDLHPLAALYRMKKGLFSEDIEEIIESHHISHEENRTFSEEGTPHYKALTDIVFFVNELESGTNELVYSNEDICSYEDFMNRARELSGKRYAKDIIEEIDKDSRLNKELASYLYEERPQLIYKSHLT